jgi:hypothetical protein
MSSHTPEGKSASSNCVAGLHSNMAIWCTISRLTGSMSILCYIENIEWNNMWESKLYTYGDRMSFSRKTRWNFVYFAIVSCVSWRK